MSDEIDVKVKATTSELGPGLAEAQGAVRAAVTTIKADFAALEGAAKAILGPFVAITGLLESGHIFMEAISKSVDLAVALDVMRQKTGMSVEELSRLKYAAELSHVSVEQLTVGLQRLAHGMEATAQGGVTPAAKAFNTLGISVTDTAGHLRPLHDVMTEIAEKFHDMPDGAEKTALAIDMFSRSGANLIPLLNRGKDGVKELEEEAEKFGATLSSSAVNDLLNYEEATKRLSATWEGAKRQLVVELVPAMITLVQHMTGAVYRAQALGHAWREAADAMGVLADAMTFRWGRAADLMLAGQREAKLGAEAMAKAIAAETAPLRVPSQAITDPDANPAIPKTLKKPKDDLLSQMRDEWNLEREGSKAVSDDLLREEIAFWEAKKNVAGVSAKDIRGIDAVIAAARMRLAGDARRAAMIEAQATRDGQLEELDVEKQVIEEKRSAREIDANDAARRLKDLSARVLAIKLDELQSERTLAEGDLVKQAEIDARIAAAKRASGREVAAIDRQTTLTIKAQWDSILSGITSAIQTSVNGIIQGTTTMGAAMKNLFKSIAAEFVSMGAKMLQSHISNELAKTGATATGTASRIALESWAAAKSIALGAWSAITRVAQYAWEGAAAAYRAIAAIPFVGPFLAPAAAAAAGLAIMSFAGKIPSAAGGYDIPAGINPMTQLHAQEMVLPASLANKVRDMADGGGSGGGHTFVVKSYDSQGVKHFFHKHGEMISDVLNGRRRNFDFGEDA